MTDALEKVLDENFGYRDGQCRADPTLRYMAQKVAQAVAESNAKLIEGWYGASERENMAHAIRVEYGLTKEEQEER